MTKREQIAAMTDAELVCAVAETLALPNMRIDDRGRVQQDCNGDDYQWTPFESMDDCWMVVTAMRENGFRFVVNGDAEDIMAEFLRHEGGISIRRGRSRLPYSKEQRAILEAALLAVEG